MLTDSVLDAARTRGDALADATVAEIFKAGDTAAVAQLFGTLMRDDQRPGDLPAPVLDYLAQTGKVVARLPESVAAGEKMFAEHGPEIFVALCCYSLPSAYAAKKGVQVLHRTAYLAKRPNRRLFETAQMIVDVMSPGGLGPNGKGLRSAQKVRLMHAAIRHLILNDPQLPWSRDEWGLPINQEDMVGTLMTFSWIILDGLQQMGIKVAPHEQQAYLDAWLVVGQLMGLEPALLPRTVDEARATTKFIERRQIAESPQGREMTAALIGMMQENLPHPLKSVPASLIREFLPPNVASFLGVDSHPLEQLIIRLLDDELRPLERFIDVESRKHALVRWFSVHLLQWMITVETQGLPVHFVLPDQLQEDWQIAPADSEESFWEKLQRRIKARL